jgi:predicted metal-dependent phosphotriesterase family hydrolase
MGELDYMINNKIQTVCGEICPDQLGHCQIHEHIPLYALMTKRNPSKNYRIITVLVEQP